MVGRVSNLFIVLITQIRNENDPNQFVEIWRFSRKECLSSLIFLVRFCAFD